MEERLRLFVAIELPAEWRASLAEVERRLDTAAPGFGRWVDPALMHLTLAFLGSQPAALLPAVGRALERAVDAAHGFSLSLSDLGSFGGPRSVRVIWQGIQDRPPGALGALHDALVEALAAERISFEAGRFRPHVTLARARRAATAAQSEAMHRAIAVASQPSRRLLGPPFDCRQIAIIRSDLRSTGPIYTPLHRAQLQD